jgi:hypothetical protein
LITLRSSIEAFSHGRAGSLAAGNDEADRFQERSARLLRSPLLTLKRLYANKAQFAEMI